MNTLPEKTVILDSLERCSATKRRCKGCAYAENCKRLFKDAALLLSFTGQEGTDALDRVVLLGTLVQELEERLRDIETSNIALKAAADQYKASCIELEASNKELFKSFNKMKALYHIKCAELDELTKSSETIETVTKNAE